MYGFLIRAITTVLEHCEHGWEATRAVVKNEILQTKPNKTKPLFCAFTSMRSCRYLEATRSNPLVPIGFHFLN